MPDVNRKLTGSEIRSLVIHENMEGENARMQPKQKQQRLKRKYYQLIWAMVLSISLLGFDVDQNRGAARDIWTQEHANNIEVAMD